jgi:hypothetical protein
VPASPILVAKVGLLIGLLELFGEHRARRNR